MQHHGLPTRLLDWTDRDKIEGLREQLEDESNHPLTRNPIAFLPPLEFPRMSAQSSRFTIHPQPSGNANVIESLLTSPREVIRYEIPRDCKAPLLRDLTALGVTAETLFRSLDALSETIKADVYDADRGEDYPDPPLFA